MASPYAAWLVGNNGSLSTRPGSSQRLLTFAVSWFAGMYGARRTWNFRAALCKPTQSWRERE